MRKLKSSFKALILNQVKLSVDIIWQLILMVQNLLIQGGQQLQFYESGKYITNSETLARLTFDVISTFKDRKSDVWLTNFTVKYPKYEIFTGSEIKVGNGTTYGMAHSVINGADVLFPNPLPSSTSLPSPQ